MPESVVGAASLDDVRAIGRRRNFDDRTMGLALQFAEAGTAWAARDESEVIGLALAHDSAEERYVGHLFVEPSYRGQGIGGRLLDCALSDVEVARAMLLDLAELAGFALAARRGIPASHTIAHFAGPMPREDALMAMAAGDYRFEVGAIDPVAHELALDALDRETRGTARPADHRTFVQLATGQAFFLRGELVAYSYAWSDGRVGPMAVASSAYAVQVLAFTLVTLNRTHGATWCSALVPSVNARVSRALLRGGLQIKAVRAFATDAHELDLTRYAAWVDLAL